MNRPIAWFTHARQRLAEAELECSGGYAFGASGSAIKGKFAAANRLFSGAFLFSLAAPPTGPSLCEQGTFGSSLKGIPPTVPSFRSTPPPLDERAIPLLKKRNDMPFKNATAASLDKNAATGAHAPVKTFRLGRIKAAVWQNEADQKKFSM